MPRLQENLRNSRDAGRGADRAPDRRAPRAKSTAREYAEAMLVALALALVFRQFIVQAFRIPSQSMEDTLLVGDFLFVNKFLYGAQLPFSSARLPKVRAPQRGDIIVFKSYDGRDFIKRCVAVPGDTVEVRGGELFRNGKRQIEPYIKHDSHLPVRGDPRDFFGPKVIYPDSIFMMGDNRDNSQDSRFWGSLAVNRVKGKAMIIYFSAASWLPPRIRFSRIGRIIR